ncbi:MAG: acylneuraminate cytidylyltransferase family protein [Phycisphaerales bacterium]|nr:MAG: acylneuraminate cytidylyltransferase family protein [Phycisphaerales bacterium]
MKRKTEDRKILAVIPARSGSKGIPHKNIKHLNGRPLIHYAIALAVKVQNKGFIIGHVVSTDSKRIASIAKKGGGNVPFLRPPELATDDSPVVETVIHAVRWWEQQNKETIHSVLLLQPTNPLTAAEDIEGAVKSYLDNQPKATCLISVCDAQHIRLSTLYHKKGKYLEQAVRQLDPASQRQSLHRLYWRNGAVYLVRRDLLLKQRKIMIQNPCCYEMPKARSVAIDDIMDWCIAEWLISCSGG